MNPRLRSLDVAAAIAILAFGLYALRLGIAPLSADETLLLRQSQAIAQTGRDLSDRTFPLFIQVGDEQWLPPIAVYSTVLMSAVAPPHLAARMASAAAGAVSVALFYLLLARIHPAHWLALAGALLFALTPAHVAYARTGTDAIYPVPFVLLWLIGIWSALSSGRRPPLLAATFALGVGVFTQPAAPLTMGFLMVVTLAALWTSGTRGMRPYCAAIAAFALPVSVAAVWYLFHPDTYTDTFGRWAIHAAHLRYPLDGARAIFNWTTMGARASIIWGTFDPSWLFFGDPAAIGRALRGAAPFLWPTALLLAIGLPRVFTSGRPGWTVALLLGGAMPPLAAATFGAPHAIGAFLPFVPFVILVAVGGVGAWRTRSGIIARAVEWGVAVSLVVEFAAFYLMLMGG